MREKLDRRKKYTRKVLKDSLIKLLATKPISDITVKEICELADINRSTFYTHYTDHYDLLSKIEEEITADMNEYLHSYNYPVEEESIQMTEKILQYVIENKFMFQTLLKQDAAPTFEKRMMDLTRGFMMNNWMNDNQLDEDELKYLSTFVISGAIHVMKDWIANDMNKPPKEMAVMINKFINYGFSYLD
ncbi:TetR family transcriptional regulator [Thalassobacillus devorans]|uniref:TetR family transcriptional regulator n=1 Tax=Thalassobacillus devorans TaxID=279813 RepID=A0ABQ1NMV5_9BACI|nr:TetR-like C-terminal domain-containing protein [Thalassobacillus devorans]NIK27129.1 AcrR family transcriptional regulator [Thalassobacillus devorans]GGC75166.1 TetR family transcriptional regulator [Thalassobacillus devorans]